MRLTVTPIGAEGTTAAVSQRPSSTTWRALGAIPVWPCSMAGEIGGAAAYYADSREGPGRWLGAGAAFQRLRGTVDRDAFQRVLEGRHPLTRGSPGDGARFVATSPSRHRDRGLFRRQR